MAQRSLKVKKKRLPRAAPVRLTELARFRQAAYRLFGAALLYPAADRMAMLVGAARELAGESEPYAGFAFFPQWMAFLTSLGRRGESGTGDLEETYLDLFVVNQKVPLYESRFLTPEAPGLTMAALDGAYRVAGLSVAGSFKEPPDHAAVELEFMSFLCGKEAEVWSKRSRQDAVQQLELEARFLDRHLSLWFPAFAEQVVHHAPNSFYASVTRAAHALIGHDQGLLAGLLAEYRQQAPPE